VVDETVKKEIRRWAPLAPLDNEYNLRGIETCERLAAGVPQVAVFDTSFHLRMPPANYLYALPADWARDPELRRIGFHGISHEGAARAVAAFLGKSVDELRMVTCHLGAGASITAIDHGRSVDNSMGFTPLEGLVMATRPGNLDPGLLLYLIEERKVPPAELRRRLYEEAGLLGLSGTSSDVVTLAEKAGKGESQALQALQVYCIRARKYLSSYMGLLGGVDAIVFTGGVGENNSGIRARILQGLEWMGIVLDEGANRAVRVGAGEVREVSQPQSRARILVAGGDEEATITRKAVAALSHKRVTDVMRAKQRAIPIGVSAHHVHLTQEHVEALFGRGHTLTWYADLTQPGQFACREKVNLVGPKGRIEDVRVLGPVRSKTQVEISRTEEFKLGLDAPIRLSGDLDGSPGITLEGDAGRVILDRGVICAMRHIHMAPQDAMEFAVRDRDVVRIRVGGDRELVFGDVAVRVDPNFRLDMHIDTDEANAAELEQAASGYLDSIQERKSSDGARAGK
jgi:acetate kinase